MIRKTCCSVIAALVLTVPATIATIAQAQVVTSGGATAAQTPTPPANPPATELLHSSTVRLLQSDYDAQLLRLPPDSRLGFGTDIDRINALLRTMLVDKTLADEARKSGVAADPAVVARVTAETDRVLAQAVMERNEAQWIKEFDAKPGMEQAARERWLAQPDKYRKPEEVKVTHILYAIPRHDAAQALALAQAARAKIVAGADMPAIAKAESDDPTAVDNGGQSDWAPAKRFDPRVVRAIAGLKKIGDLSQPVKTPGGYYLIRLDARRGGEVRPFADVKDEIIGEFRRAYVDDQRQQRMAAIRNDPSIVVNQPAVDALVVRIAPQLLDKHEGDAPAPAAPR